MFAPIYNRYDIPTNHRATLTRYFNRQNGIPASIRHYFLDKKWARFIRECMCALTDRFLTRLKEQNVTDFELLVARDIATLRTRHEAIVTDYMREVFDFPEIAQKIVETFWRRMRTVKIDERITTNAFTGERDITPLIYRELNRAGNEIVRRAGLWPEFLARGKAALMAAGG